MEEQRLIYTKERTEKGLRTKQAHPWVQGGRREEHVGFEIFSPGMQTATLGGEVIAKGSNCPVSDVLFLLEFTPNNWMVIKTSNKPWQFNLL